MSAPASAFLGEPLTSGYAPRVVGPVWSVNSQRPPFKLQHLDTMLPDPQIQFGLRAIYAPLAGAKWKVRANSHEVQAFVDATYRRIWERSLRQFSRFVEYGHLGGETLYKREAGKVHYDGFRDIHPLDTQPLLLKQKLVGLLVKNVPQGEVRIGAPRMVWLTNEPVQGGFYGRSRLEAAWVPWMEKNGRCGALDQRRLHFFKNASRGDVMYYPIGTTDMGTPGTPMPRSNQDIANEIVEKMVTGGTLAMPGDVDPTTNKRKWELTPPSSNNPPGQLLDYIKDIDMEILKALGVPPEVLQSTGESGSGYAGRAIPATVFYASEDELVSTLIHTLDKQIVKWLVRVNFGKNAKYKIDVESLAPPQQPPGGGGAAGPGGGAPPQGGKGGGDGGAGGAQPKYGKPGLVPYKGPRGGVGVKNPNTGRVKYGRFSLSNEMARRVRREANRIYPQLRRGKRGWVRMSNGEATGGDGDDGEPGAALKQKLNRAVLLAMLDAQGEAHDRGDPASAHPELEALAELAHGGADLASLLKRLRRVRMSGWQNVGTRPSGKNAWMRVNPATGHREYRYQKTEPGLPRQPKPDESPADTNGQSQQQPPPDQSQAADEQAAPWHQPKEAGADEAVRSLFAGIVNDSIRGSIPVGKFVDVVDHLPKVPVADLRAARIKLGGGFRDDRQREAVVAAVRKHVAGIVEHEGEPPHELKESAAGKRYAAAQRLKKAKANLSDPMTHEEAKEYGDAAQAFERADREYRQAHRAWKQTVPVEPAEPAEGAAAQEQPEAAAAEALPRQPRPGPGDTEGAGLPADPKPGKVYTAPTKSLKVDPARFQFKLNTNDKGVTAELSQVKKWNPDFAGVISVWKDPADGHTYVVNGHHRKELADRLDVPDMAVRYVHASTAEEARALGALVNIAEGRGTAVDAAKFMRDMRMDPEKMQGEYGVSLKGPVARDAATLTKLADPLFHQLATGQLDQDRALAIAAHLKPELQGQLVQWLDKREKATGKEYSPKVVAEFARQMQATPTTTSTEQGLFGADEHEESLFAARGELAAGLRGELSKEANDWKAVASDRRADTVGTGGNVLNVAGNKEKADTAHQTRAVFDQLAHSKGHVAEALNQFAGEYANAKTTSERAAVRQRALEAVRAATQRELGGGVPDAGATQGGGGAEPAPVRPGAPAPPRAAEPQRRDPESAGVKPLTHDQAKAIMQATPAPASLPEDHAAYFTDTAKTVPMEKIKATRARPKGIENAAKYMEASRLGKLPKRAPVKVVANDDGTYSVADGNSTFANAQKNGWKSLPVEVVSQEWAAAEKQKTIDKETAKAVEVLSGAKLFTPEEHALPSDVRTPFKTKDALYDVAHGAKADFDTILDSGKGLDRALGGTSIRPKDDAEYAEALKKPGPIVIIAPLKGEKRAAEKVEADYGGDWSRLHDAVRATVAVDTAADVPKTVEALREQLKQAGWEVAKPPKNRFESPTDAGYRDIMLNVKSPSGMVAEVQINTKAMVHAKHVDGHPLYEKARAIQAAASGREMTPDEAAEYDRLGAEMKAVYDKAWHQSLGLEGEHVPEVLRPERAAGAADEPVAPAGDDAAGRQLEHGAGPASVLHGMPTGDEGAVSKAGPGVDAVGSDSADFAPQFRAIPEGELGFVGGYPVRRTGENEYRLETEHHHVTGPAATVEARIRRQWSDQRIGEGKAVDAALARAKDYQEPNVFTDREATEKEAAARKAVPKGTRVISLDPETRGRIGTVTYVTGTDGKRVQVVSLDGSPDVHAQDFEPLDKTHSWRVPKGAKVVVPAEPKATQKTLDELYESEEYQNGEPDALEKAEQLEKEIGVEPAQAPEAVAQVPEPAAKGEATGEKAKPADKIDRLADVAKAAEPEADDISHVAVAKKRGKPTGEYGVYFKDGYFANVQADSPEDAKVKGREAREKRRAELAPMEPWDGAEAADRRKDNKPSPTANTLKEDTSSPTVPHGELGSAGPADPESGLHPQEPVGADAPPARGEVPAEAGEGPQGKRRLRSVSNRRGAKRPQPDGTDDLAGDDAGRGAAASADGPAADAAGRGEPAASVGEAGGRGRLIAGPDQLPPSNVGEREYVEPASAGNPTDVGVGANYRYADREFFKGGKKAKFNANVEALKTLRAIQSEGRTSATPEEQAILSRFIGWGQFPEVFDDYGSKVGYDESQKWKKERAVLKELLAADDWEAAAGSTLNSHYTHPDIVDAHWKMAERLGFKGGRFLETSAGIGYYLGMMPANIAAKTKATAVEKDPGPGGMLQLLYPKANVQVQGFEEHQAPHNFYDLVASNVPFGAFKVHDPEYNKHQAHIHDYFFLKSADKVRPGGLVMHITSTGTLDKADPKIRKKLAEQCDLVSAIRFPGSAHEENAGTAVVTDMVILRKRLPGEAPGDQSWLETTTVPDPAGGEPIPVNKYFVDHPEQVLGQLDRTGEMRGADQVNVSKITAAELSAHLRRPVEFVKRDESDDRTAAANKKGSFLYSDGTRVPSEVIDQAAATVYKEKLDAAIARLPEGLFQPVTTPPSRLSPKAMPAPGHVKNGGFHIEGGKLHVREGGGIVERNVKPDDLSRIQGHLDIRDARRAVVNAELSGEDATTAREHLNSIYDSFVKKYGPLHGKANRKSFDTDPDAPTILALEKYDAKAKTVAKADIFHKTTISAIAPATHADSVDEGLGISLHEKGGVDVEHIAKLTKQTPETVGKHLVANGLAYEHPSEGWQPADVYLSGNVRQKLVMARAAAKNDPKYEANVKALDAVQPADIDHTQITPRLGAHWIPPKDVEAFAAETLGVMPGLFQISYVPTTGKWHAMLTPDGHRRLAGNETAKTWTTEHYGGNFADLLESALNMKSVRIYDGSGDDKVYNKEHSDAVNGKIGELKEKFADWVWQDDARRERLHRFYNDNFNNVRLMQYNGSHLKLPGKNPDMEVRDHVKNFVWQVVTTGKGLAAHEVGTGKTRAMIASAMELRRLGLARKPAIACLKANVEGVTEEARQLYPGAKILSTADMFDAKKRKETISRIATGDYDMVIMTHDHLNLLPMRPEVQAKFIQEEIDQLVEAKAAVEAQEEAEGKKGRNKTRTKKLEEAKEKLEVKLKAALAADKKDNAVFFEETGIDHLFVDEAQQYKTLPCYTQMENMKGVPTGRSQRATNMLMRTRWLLDQNNGRGVVFATGTPISNSMPELYTMQRYLQPEELKQAGITNFDAWARLFGESQTDIEPSVTGEFKTTSRFNKFVNVPELLQMSRQMMDVRRCDDIKTRESFPTEEAAQRHAAQFNGATVEPGKDGTFTVVRPAIIRPKRQDHLHTAQSTPALESFMKSLVRRSAELDPRNKSADNMLAICTDGRKAAIDLRLVNPNAADDPGSKVNKLVANVLKFWKEDPESIQAVFSDLGTNPVDPSKRGADEIPDEFADEEDPDVQADADAVDATMAGTGKFHLYGEIIKKLVKGGIPREKIADFSKLSDTQKTAAQQALRDGKMLVALGSTQKLGTGVNIQNRLKHMHHLDAPWRPADIEQRNGRGHRQGNKHKQVNVHTYVTEKSLDAFNWGVLAQKAGFINQAMSTDISGIDREITEMDTTQMSPEHLMAAATGNPHVLDKVRVDDEVKKLQAAHSRHEAEQARLKHSVKGAEAKIRREEEYAKDGQADLRILSENPEKWVEAGGKRYDEKAKPGEAADALKAAYAAAPRRGYEPFKIGAYRGFDIVTMPSHDANGNLTGDLNVFLETPKTGRRVAVNVGFVENPMSSLAGGANRIRHYAQQGDEKVTAAKADHAKLKEQIGKPFAKAEDLVKKLARQKELEKLLAPEPEKPAPAA